jgi:cation diffusion facilitator CzcD-associated flavoprotein CzcO
VCLCCVRQSVLVVGSANTAFDIIEDCHNSGLQTTMIQRSPTYLIPLAYLHDLGSLGLYDVLPTRVADELFQTGPLQLNAQLVGLFHANRAAQEP